MTPLYKYSTTYPAVVFVLYKYSTTYPAVVFVGLALQMALLRKAPFQPLGVVQNGVVWATVTNEDNILIGKAFPKWSVSISFHCKQLLEI